VTRLDCASVRGVGRVMDVPWSLDLGPHDHVDLLPYRCAICVMSSSTQGELSALIAGPHAGVPKSFAIAMSMNAGTRRLLGVAG